MNIRSTPIKHHTKECKRQFGWLEQTVAGITGAIEHAIFTEELTCQAGWLQGRDPRAKLGMFLIAALAASLSSSLVALTILYLLLLCVARASQVPLSFFVKRVWLGIPLFSGIVILPAIFLPTGPHLFEIVVGFVHLGPSTGSLLDAAVFVARVGVTVSLAVLLILSTQWSNILKSLRILHVPPIFIMLLAMTYRYIFLFLHTANGILEARKSRMVGKTSGNEQRQWISGTMSNLMHRSFKMSNDVYAAMQARGFTGEIPIYSVSQMTLADWLALAGTIVVAMAVLIVGRWLV